MGVLATYRSRQSEEFGDAETDLMQCLLPHFHRSVLLQKRLALDERDRSAVTDAIDHVPYGVIVVDDRGYAIHMNRAASVFLAESDGLMIDREGFCRAGSLTENAVLTSLIGEAAETGTAGSLSPGGAMTIGRRSSRRPPSTWCFRFIPIRQSDRKTRPIG